MRLKKQLNNIPIGIMLIKEEKICFWNEKVIQMLEDANSYSQRDGLLSKNIIREQVLKIFKQKHIRFKIC